ncbi:MAG: DegT/DnrJ/EryC1/StrS family aminotransferase [Bryobacteraceae bacterium]
MTRRTVMAAAAASTAVSGAVLKPALLGGEPLRKQPFPAWPVLKTNDEAAWMQVLRSGKWYRGSGKAVDEFEARFVAALGARHCLAVANGTAALITALHGLDVQAGDEVIVPPYTFIATVNAVLAKSALPVFVDSDARTFQMDASKIEAAITDRTVAVIPVHIAGAPPNLDKVLEVGRRRKLKILEDAAQAHLGEWRGRKLGTLGDAGTFSFQASKNLNSGEGGAVLSSDSDLIERCYAYHTNSSPRKGARVTPAQGANLRLTEFQATLLMTQMERLEMQSKTRDGNAAYLTKLLGEIPGITPAALEDGCTRSAWHLYMLRYDATEFNGLPRERFLKALAAEGVPCSSGYGPLNKQPFLENVLNGRGYQRLFSADRLRHWRERNECPVNDLLCKEGVWFTQTMLLGAREDMEQIAAAISKIRAHAGELAKLSG